MLSMNINEIMIGMLTVLYIGCMLIVSSSFFIIAYYIGKIRQEAKLMEKQEEETKEE